jgi:hypothetical protein
MVTECFQVLKPSDKCGVTIWVTVGWTPDVREALATITSAPPFTEDEIFMGSFGDGKPWCRAECVKQKLEDHGFTDVKVDVVPTLPPLTMRQPLSARLVYIQVLE